MGSKFLASYSIAPLTQRDAKLVSAHAHLMQAIKWSGDISQAVVKDYLISINTRVRKLKKFVDPSISPTWLYTNPTVAVTGYNVQALAQRLAEEEYPTGVISVSVSPSTAFNWNQFLTRHYKSKIALGYNANSNLNNTSWGGFSGMPGDYDPAYTYEDGGNTVDGAFRVRLHTKEIITTTTGTPPVTTTTTNYYPRLCDIGDVPINTSGECTPGVHTPVLRSGDTPTFYTHFGVPGSILTNAVTFGTGVGWDYPHIELLITFNNGKSTVTWYDMKKWDTEAGKEPIVKTTLPDTILPMVPIRLNKLNVTDPSLLNNPIAKSIRDACRKLQMKPKSILDSIKNQGGMSETQVEEQVDGEIEEEERIALIYTGSYTPPTAAERQQRIDDLLTQEQDDALESKNDIFIAFLTSLATENVWEKELLYWTFHRYYLDNVIMLTKSPGEVFEVEVDIPDLYYRFSFLKIEKSIATTYPTSLTEDKYSIEVIPDPLLEPVYPYGDQADPEYYVYKSHDLVRLLYMDDTSTVHQLDIHKFTTSLGTPKDLETWDGTLPTDADSYLWCINTIGDKTGDAKDIALNKHCIPIHQEVLEERSNALITDTPAVRVHKFKLRKRCYEYGVSFLIVDLKKVHVPWWKSWLNVIVFFITAALQIYAITNLWNPTGWTVQAVMDFVTKEAVAYVIKEIIQVAINELIKFLPTEVAALIVIAISLLTAGLSGDFDGLDNIELALEIVDVTSSGTNLVLSAENRQTAKLDSALQDKIEKLDQDLKDAKEFLESLDPNRNKFKEGAFLAQYGESVDPYRFVHEQTYYGDTSALHETPSQFFERTIRTTNPGLVTINSTRLTNTMLLDPTSNMDLGII